MTVFATVAFFQRFYDTSFMPPAKVRQRIGVHSATEQGTGGVGIQ